MIEFFKPQGNIIFSYRVRDLVLRTDAEFIDVELWFNSNLYLKNRYYSFDGYVIIHKFQDMFSEYIFTQRNQTICTCRLTASTGTESITETFNLFYCDKDLLSDEPPVWLENNFLSSARYIRIAPDDAVRLSWYAVDQEPIRVIVDFDYLDLDGDRQVSRDIFNSDFLADGDRVYDFTLETGKIRNVAEEESGGPVILLSMTCRVNSRAMTIYIDENLADAKLFAFVNCFNQFETMRLCCQTKTLYNSEVSTAVVSDVLKRYDVRNEVEYECETAALTSDESSLMLQFLTSASTGIYSDRQQFSNPSGVLNEIIITDSTFEPSDNNDELVKAKFNWQFADRFIRIDGLIDNRVFNLNYSPQFS